MTHSLSNSSYEEYMKDQLMLLSKNFKVKTYKRANEDDWSGFVKGEDFRIQIQWKGKPIFEFVIERPFWYQRNLNKEDRLHMRRFADQKIQMLKGGLIRKSAKPIKSKIKIGNTQDLFENMKKT